MKGDSSKSEGKNTFKWTDDEVEALLKVMCDYKVSKAADGIDWESTQSKYAELMLAQYPETPEAAKDLEQGLPTQVD